MKKRILSLVLCAALLLSLCLFMGAGVVGDAAADMAETAGTVEDTQSSPAVGPILPLVVTRPQTSPYRAARAPSLADTGETQDDGLKLTKTVTPKADGGFHTLYPCSSISAAATRQTLPHWLYNL